MDSFASPIGVQNPNANHSMAVYGKDENLIVHFERKPHLDRAESEKRGRPIYKDRDYITIRVPGDKNRVVERPVRMNPARGQISDPERFPRQWQAYQSNQQVTHDGTPLSEWGPMSKSQAMTYQGLNIYTVEQLAGVSDANLGQMGHGARAWRDKAQAYLKATEDSSEVLKLQSQLSKQTDEIEMLKQQIAELATTRRKPGRPKKTES